MSIMAFVSSWLNTVILAILVGLFTVVYLLTRRPRGFPPGPFAFPVVGNILQLGPEPHKYFARLRDTYGDVLSIKLGGHWTVVINGIDNIQEILLSMKNKCAGRPPFDSKFILDGVGVALSDYDSKWLWKKKQIVKALGTVLSDKTFDFGGLIERSHEDLIKDFASHNGRSFDPYYDQNLASYCVGYNFLFNKNDDLRKAEGKYDFKRIFDIQKGANLFVQIGNIFNVLSWLRWVYPWGYASISERNEDVTKLTVDCVDTLSDTYDPADIRGIVDCFFATSCETEEDRKGLLIGLPELLSASFDTTAASLLWTYLFLVKNEDVQQRVQASIDQVVGHARVCLDDRKRLPLVEAVILEAMRMEMPIPLGLPKWTLEDCELKGYSIPKGTVVITNFYSVNLDPTLWDKPEHFRPERFLKIDGSVDREKEQNLLAFGIGLRKCPGEAVARAQLFIAVASVLQRFSLKKVPGEKYDVIGCPGLTSSPPRFKIIAKER